MAGPLLSLTALLLIITTPLVLAQTSNYANEFYTGFSKSLPVPGLTSLNIYVTTTENTPVVVNLYNSSDAVIDTLTVQQNKSGTFLINSEAWTVSSSAELQKGLRVKAEDGKKIAVFGSNAAYTSAALFLVLPSYTYPGVSEYQYIALTSTGHRNSTVLLVASQDETTVTVQPRVTIKLPAAVTNGAVDVEVNPNESYTFVLQRLQSLLLESSGDLSGTKFISNRPLSVISGHQCAQVPDNVGLCDQILEQIPPTLTWGKLFMSVPFTNRLRGTYYRIIAAEDSTKVTISCSKAPNSTVLFADHSGDVLMYSAPVNASCSFVATGPILLGQYSASKESGQAENIGTPLLMAVPPVEQYMMSDRVVIPSSPITANMVTANVITSSTCIDHITTVTVGGVQTPITWQPILSTNRTVLGYGAALALPDSSNVEIILPSSIPMVSFTYGYSTSPESYGSLVSTDLQQISDSSTIVPGFTQSRYTFSERDQAASITLERALNTVPVDVSIRRCNGSPSDAWVDRLVDKVTFNVGESSKVVPLPIVDDDEVKGTSCVCLEVVANCYSIYQLTPVTQTTVCVEDDDSVSVTLSRASVVDEQLELTVDVGGEFRGDIPVTLELYPVVGITNDDASTGGRRQTSNEVTMQLAPLRLCITKDLSQAVLRRPLNQTERSSTISSIGLRLNSSVNVTVPANNTITLTTPTPSPSPLTPTQSSLLSGALILYIVIGALGLIVLVLSLIVCILLSCYCRTCCCRSGSVDLEKVQPTPSLRIASGYPYSSQQMLFNRHSDMIDHYKSSQSLQSSHTNGSVRNISAAQSSAV